MLSGTMVSIQIAKQIIIKYKPFFFLIEEIGQRAYVGKVCMDQNEGSSYKEDTKKSLQETER